MASLLSWVDYSSTHRDDMDRLLDAFRDKGTVDELGIGTVRDAFSDLLFPGTSTLHTRARYLLFVPWAVTTTTGHRYPSDRAARELRSLEVRLIESLRRGDPDGGVIGRDARASLKRMPSVVYWGAMSRYDIKRCQHGVEQHLRFVTERPPPSVDEDEDARLNLDPCFRQLPPPPENWLTNTDFDLTRDEAEFLRDQILTTCADHYLAYLVRHGIPGDPHVPWDETLTSDLPPEPASALAHARRFSQLHHGAQILYNLLLARDKGWQEGVVDYEERLAMWSASANTHAASTEWRADDFWSCLARARWRRNSGTHTFVTEWIKLVNTGALLSGSSAAEQLIRDRERRLKGSRSRFVNHDALEAWEGGSGMGRLTYRWQQTKTLVTDIHRGLEASVA